VEISKMAMRVAAKQQIPYLRFERLAVDKPTESFPVISLNNFEALVASDYLYQQRVLLTVGYKVLPLFQNWQDNATLFARILPAVTSLETAIASGFSPERIIALRPPITAELEKALWQQWAISLVVTKASGVAGGEDIKRMVAAELGIPLIVIDRPAIDYPQQTSELSVALEFCKRYLASVSAES
jgi:precorrin-6A/cobalt-precorrin-6A reductase